MTIIKGRIERIRKNLRTSQSKYDNYKQFIAIDKWRYGLANTTQEAGQAITLQYWQTYYDREIEYAKKRGKLLDAEREMKKLENKIDRRDGFMKIEFVNMRKPL